MGSTAGASTSSGTVVTDKFFLVSSDEIVMCMSSASAAFSGVIEKKLQEAKKKENEKRVVLERYDEKTLRPVVKYLHLREDGKAEEFFRGKNPKIGKLLDMLLTADELDIPGMVEAVSEKIAGKMKNKSVEWVRAAFGIQADLTEADEAKIRDQYPWAFEGVVDQDGKKEDEDEDDQD